MPRAFDNRNRFFSLVKGVNVRRGDVPDELKQRYRVESNGGHSVHFYIDSQTNSPAVRDRGRDLIAPGVNPSAVRDMVAIAQHRAWPSIYTVGAMDFRREVFLTGQAQGLAVFGYPATERDLPEIERRRDEPTRRRLELDAQRVQAPPTGQRASNISPFTRLRVGGITSATICA